MKVSHSKIWLTLIIGSICLFTNQSILAKTEVKFDEPESFRDVIVTGNSKARSLTKLNKELNALFEELSKNYISANETLLIKVTELDLAGDIEPMVGPRSEDIRVVRDNDSYHLNFNYEVINENGDITQKGVKEIKNFVSQNMINRMSKDNSVSHFERDLAKWFKESAF